jgi:hypothetical protein
MIADHTIVTEFGGGVGRSQNTLRFYVILLRSLKYWIQKNRVLTNNSSTWIVVDWTAATVV